MIFSNTWGKKSLVKAAAYAVTISIMLTFTGCNGEIVKEIGGKKQGDGIIVNNAEKEAFKQSEATPVPQKTDNEKKDTITVAEKDKTEEKDKKQDNDKKQPTDSVTKEVYNPVISQPNNNITDPQIAKVLKDIPGNLSNEKLGWWFSKNSEHKPTTVNPSNIKEIADKYNGIYIGDTSRKVIYLTFDEGYENGYTPSILDTLKANKVRATFFITTPYLKGSTDLVERMIKEGHVVGNHTVTHPSMPGISNAEVVEEITMLHRQVEEKFNYRMNLIRPPMGEFSERTMAITQKLGYKTVFWSFAYMDWDVNNQKGADYAYQQVMDNYHNGEVMLLHAVSKDNTEALDRIIKELKKLGFVFETPDLLK